MKNICIAALALLTGLSGEAIGIADINVRDPFIYVNQADSTYYLYRSKGPAWDIGAERGVVQLLKSRDLIDWTDPEDVLVVPADNWATGVIWAPEMHEIDGKYYMFATVNDPLTWKAPAKGHKYELRGTQIFVSDSPSGPFLALEEKLPATPMGHMCLDGTFYRENGRNYMVYCHEWVEMTDGTVEVVELDPDMRPASAPIPLFCGSAAPWARGWEDERGDTCYVTDGVFLYRSPQTGNLYMIWSGFCDGGYAIGVARSKTGRVTGPWIHNPTPLFDRDGGHGMIFKDLDGKLRLVLHGPNNPEGAERARLFEIEEADNTLRLKCPTRINPSDL